VAIGETWWILLCGGSTNLLGTPKKYYVGKKVDGAYLNVIDIFKGWMEYLVTSNLRPEPGVQPIPAGIKWILCQHEACVIAKCERQTQQARIAIIIAK